MARVCGIVFADARDKELLAQCNITHILSIHDTAAPILGVSSPLQTSVTFTVLPFCSPSAHRAAASVAQNRSLNWLTCCTNGSQSQSDGLLHAGLRRSFPSSDLFVRRGHSRCDQSHASQRHCARRSRTASIKGFEIDHFKRCESHIVSFQFCAKRKVLKGGIYPVSPAGGLDTRTESR